MTTAAIIQARMGASRLPGKMALTIRGETIIEAVLARTSRVFKRSDIYVATSTNRCDDFIADIANSLGINVYRGSNNNVLSRYTEIATNMTQDYVCRLTGDSPLNLVELAPLCANRLRDGDLDYVSTTLKDDYPVGVHVEVFKRECLVERLPTYIDELSREHVTPFIYNSGNFKCAALRSEKKYPNARLTLDCLDDFDFFYKLADYCDKRLSEIQENDLEKIAKTRPELFDINNHILKSRSISDSDLE